MSPMVIIIILIIVIASVIIAKKMKTKSTEKTDSPVSPPTPTGPSPEDQLKQILEALVKLNLLVRKDKSFPADMTKEIEAIIDDLAAVTPAMMERYPGETLTYEIKKIGNEHLFKTVKEYLDLSDESRKNQLDIFKKTIASLHDVSKRSRDIVEKNETAEFKTMANFLATKF